MANRKTEEKENKDPEKTPEEKGKKDSEKAPEEKQGPEKSPQQTQQFNKDLILENIMKDTFGGEKENIYEISKEELIKSIETERKYLENELIKTRNKLSNLQTELSRLKSPPLIIGTIVDLLVDGRAIVKSTTGPRFVVQIANFIDEKDLHVGARVSMNKDTLCIIGILPSSKDPLITSAEVIESPDTDFSQIGGLKEQINEIRETVELPLTHPEKFERLGIDPPVGILLVGPPGTGKTLLAKAVAAESKSAFIRLVGSELVQKYIGEGARLVRELFELGREKAPSIIFIDEIDAIAGKRQDSSTSADREVQRTMIQLLAELDGFNKRTNVRILAATNRPDILDPALIRPGRFDRIIRIPLPDIDGMVEIFKIHTKKMTLARDVNLKVLAEKSEGMNGAQIKAICTEAGMYALREDKDQIYLSNFLAAVEKLRSTKGEEWKDLLCAKVEKSNNMFA
jgi:proteasome regulatory subunit